MDKKKIKNRLYIYIKEVILHIIVCGVLAILNPGQIVLIFLIGLIIPDSLILIMKILIEFHKLSRKNYLWLKKVHLGIHFCVLAASLVFLYYGYPFIAIAGISHLILDWFGF